MHLVLGGKNHRRVKLWHIEHVDDPFRSASEKAWWHETLTYFNVTLVCLPRRDNVMAGGLSRSAYPKNKGMTNVAARPDEDDTTKANEIIEMERVMEQEEVKRFVVIAARVFVSRRVGRSVRSLGADTRGSYQHLLPDSCLQDNWTKDFRGSHL